MRKDRFLAGIYSLLLLFLCSTAAEGQMFRKQTASELEFGAGPVFILSDIGDVGKGGDLGVAFRYRVMDRLALRAALSGGILFGNDAGSENDSRGYKYYAYFGELSGQLELWFLKEGRGFSSQGMRAYKPRVRPYLFAGGGPVFFYPTHYHENADPLEDFNSYTIMLLGGVGALYKISHDWQWGIQVGARIIPSDYLDGFSPADSKANDMYFSSQINLVRRF
jgi:hypothetical protein